VRHPRCYEEHIFVSAKTAETHVQHIHENLGVSTRAAAAMFAMRSGVAATFKTPRQSGGSPIPPLHEKL